MQPQLAFKIAGKSPVLKGRDFLHPILAPSYRSQTSSWSQLSRFQVHYRFSRDQSCHFIVKRIFVGKTCLELGYRDGYQSVWGFPVWSPGFYSDLHTVPKKFARVRAGSPRKAQQGPFRGHLVQCKEYILRKERAILGVFLLRPFSAMGFLKFSLKSRVFQQNLVYFNVI